MPDHRSSRVPLRSLIIMYECGGHKFYPTTEIAEHCSQPIEKIRYYASGLGYYNTGKFSGQQAAAIVRKMFYLAPK